MLKILFLFSNDRLEIWLDQLSSTAQFENKDSEIIGI